ncbi:hypothetical protein [Streptomyces sp. bgisy032]|uniref:hypothetical protein n=1 Tax=Streptomyces sp. bgisy032 TaxID=3413773 RepID=UPI003D74C148
MRAVTSYSAYAAHTGELGGGRRGPFRLLLALCGLAAVFATATPAAAGTSGAAPHPGTRYDFGQIPVPRAALH